MRSAKRNAKPAERFFTKVLKAKHTKIPRVINVDKNLAYPPARKKLKEAQLLPKETQLLFILFAIEPFREFIEKYD